MSGIRINCPASALLPAGVRSRKGTKPRTSERVVTESLISSSVRLLTRTGTGVIRLKRSSRHSGASTSSRSEPTSTPIVSTAPARAAGYKKKIAGQEPKTKFRIVPMSPGLNRCRQGSQAGCRQNVLLCDVAGWSATRSFGTRTAFDAASAIICVATTRRRRGRHRHQPRMPIQPDCRRELILEPEPPARS